MIVSINQPAYLPWLGYFDRVDLSDLHIVLDHVQFEKNSFVNRNKIRTPQGWTWLTVPLSTKGKFGALPIHALRAADAGRWRSKHWKTIVSNYARAPNYGTVGERVHGCLEKARDGTEFLPVVEALNALFMGYLGIKTPILSSSNMGVTSRKSDLVLDLCRKVGAITYVSGPLGRQYLDLDAFKSEGINVQFHVHEAQTYRQIWPGFESGMAALDALLCLPAEEARHIMTAGRRLSPGTPSR